MQLETIAGIVVGIIVLAPALFFTYETSEGQGVPLKLAKRCGVMAIIGVFLMILSGGLGH